MAKFLPIDPRQYKIQADRLNQELTLYTKMYDSIRIKGPKDPNLDMKKDLGRVRGRLLAELNQLNQRMQSCDKKFVDKEIARRKAERFKKLYSKLCENDPNLPYSLNRNKVLKEVPFEQLYTTYKDHRRMTVFAQKGLKCVHPECDRVGNRLILSLDISGGIHIDLFTADFHLMTVDHIYPKSLGGGEEIENKQPMCQHHNSVKSNKVVPY